MAYRTRRAHATETRDEDASSCRLLHPIRQSVSKRHDRQCRIRVTSGWKHRRTRDVQILYLVRSTVSIDDARGGISAHARRSHVMAARRRTPDESRRVAWYPRACDTGGTELPPKKLKRAAEPNVVFWCDPPVERRSWQAHRVDLARERYTAFCHGGLLCTNRQMRRFIGTVSARQKRLHGR